MIFIDSRESIPISGAIPVNGLESWTGADIMVSRKQAPCSTRTLLDAHIDSGAILIQLKIKDDLSSSVGDRLNDSLARMRSVTKRTASHWLVYVGILDCDKDGSATINGHRTHNNASYATISGALVGWIARGGVPYNLPRIEMLDGLCHSMENKLIEFEREQYKYAFNQQDMPDDLDEALQIPVRITDARRVLIGFKGLGPELVNRIWAYAGDFKSALAFLTDPNSVGKLEGVGPKTIASIRKQCGLLDSDGYVGWGKDAVDTEVYIPKVTKSAAELKADTEILFGKNGKKR